MADQLHIMLKLIKSVLDDNFEDRMNISEAELDKLIKLAKEHSLEPLIATALNKQCDGISTKKKQELQMLLYKFVYLFQQKKTALEELSKVFDEAKIPYIKLKGSRLKDFYPEEWMRTSCDIDVLVPEEDVRHAEKEVIEKLSYKKELDNYHDISLFSPRNVHLELHFNIQENMDNLDRVLKKVWEYSYHVKNSMEYLQTNEFFVFHNVAHMAYHFMHGGCGIRPLIDCYLLKNKMQYDEKEVRRLCKEAEIERFYESMLELLDVWFEGKEHTKVTEKMEEFIVNGGTFGTSSNSLAIKQNETGGKTQYLLSRIFMSYEGLKKLYPSIEGKKWLMPFYEVRRWYDRLAGKDVSKYIREFKISQNLDEQHVDEVKNMLEQLGLMK